jgi:hypothetical protein
MKSICWGRVVFSTLPIVLIVYMNARFAPASFPFLGVLAWTGTMVLFWVLARLFPKVWAATNQRIGAVSAGTQRVIRKNVVAFVIGYFAYAVAACLFPPLTVDFWELAASKDVAFSVIGMNGSQSPQFLACARIDSSLCPALSYRILFRVGTPAAKCHALVGIRSFDRDDFEEYSALLSASDASVEDRWMDIGIEVKVADLARLVRDRKEYSAHSWLRDFDQWYRQKQANQPPLQTPASGTPAAGAPVAPPSGAAGR